VLTEGEVAVGRAPPPVVRTGARPDLGGERSSEPFGRAGPRWVVRFDDDGSAARAPERVRRATTIAARDTSTVRDESVRTATTVDPSGGGTTSAGTSDRTVNED
jgi:hypothetical protein